MLMYNTLTHLQYHIVQIILYLHYPSPLLHTSVEVEEKFIYCIYYYICSADAGLSLNRYESANVYARFRIIILLTYYYCRRQYVQLLLKLCTCVRVIQRRRNNNNMFVLLCMCACASRPNVVNNKRINYLKCFREKFQSHQIIVSMVVFFFVYYRCSTVSDFFPFLLIFCRRQIGLQRPRILHSRNLL